ncbi:MAG TPA: NAD(P)-dependent oxidoreductase [Firmicutes bacterium]|nr:NAD(P)-dependent oxidoreductase [Bacillota bacterium]
MSEAEDSTVRPLAPVGWIGLGIMGRPMAANLLRAGYPLTVFSRRRSSADELVAAGAVWAGSPAEVAAASEVVFTMVTDSAAVEEVVLGREGVLSGAHPGLILVDMSTIAPAMSRKIAAEAQKRGVRCLDAPVSGGEKGAREGTLSIMVGGDVETLAACRPLLEVLGKKITYVGPAGAGQTLKLVNQVVCGLNLLAMAEGLALADRAGLDLKTVLEAITGGAASSWMLENLGPKVAAGDFDPGFTVRLQQKDLRLALEMAAELAQPLPGTALVHQLFRYLEARGESEEGTQALYKVLRQPGLRGSTRISAGGNE